jgi:hypothetical protein
MSNKRRTRSRRNSPRNRYTPSYRVEVAKAVLIGISMAVLVVAMWMVAVGFGWN